MLVVPVHLDSGTKRSKGLYASVKIKKNDLVWVFDPHVDVLIPKSIVVSWSGESRKQVETWAYLSEDQVYMLCVDEMVFMKHADFLCNVGTGSETDQIVALKDIDVGEELIGRKQDWMYDKLPAMAAMSKINSLIQ